jgi:LPS sulfotransferase NodH
MNHSQRKAYDLTTELADYPRWEGPPRRSYLVCANARTGSTLLGEALYRAGGFGCPLEYFHVGFRPAFEARWQTADDDQYLARLYERRVDPTGTFGVKFFWQDLRQMATKRFPARAHLWQMDLCRDPGAAQAVFDDVAEVIGLVCPHPRFIFLRRLDRLRQAVSTHVASVTSEWRSIIGQECQPAVVPSYDHEAIRRAYENARRSDEYWERFFMHAKIDCHRVMYEDLSNRYQETLADLLKSFGREQQRPVPSPRLRRQADGVTEGMVRRFLEEELARRAHGDDRPQP